MEFSFPPHRIRVNVPDRDSLLRAVEGRLRRREGFALATINLDHLVKLAREPAFRPVYAAQDLVVADGNPVVWLSRLARRPVALVPGSDLVLPLAGAAVRAGVPVALIGATADALEAAASVMRERVPGLEVAAMIAPPMGFDPEGSEAAAMIGALERSGAGLVFVALGAPKQEVFAARGRALAPRLGFASIGAGLDFLAGTQQRAPAWMRALALEWLWRMLSNPRRLAVRYLRCVLILPGQALAAWRQRG